SRHKIAEPLRIEFISQEDQFEEDPPVATMTDNCTRAEMLRAPTEGFYNALNLTDQDSFNAAAGGNLLERCTQDVLTIIENKSKVRNSRSKLIASQVKACDTNSTPVKAVEETCVTCGGAHPYYQCLAAGGNTFPELRDNIQEYGSAAAANYNQGNSGYRPQGVANQMRPPGFAQSNVQNNQHRFGPPQGYNRGNNFNQEPSNTEDVQPQAASSKHLVSTSEPANTPVSASKPNLQASIPYPSRRNDERNREKANNQIEKFYQLFKYMSFEISFTDALILMPKFASNLKALIGNKEKLSEMARTPLNEHCSAVLLKKLREKLGDPGKFLIPCDFSGMAECLALVDLGMAECFALVDLGASINLMPYSV
nr:reverse transcriptase domain-containing protein [Tanacetum cinerariifolium]